MNMIETRDWQRENAGHIDELVKQGDKLAIRLVDAYRYLYDHQLDPQAQTVWLQVCDDFARRDLTKTTRVILQDRFGVKPPKDLRRIDS